MKNPQVAKYISKLKRKDASVRQNAADTLVEIGVAAVPALIVALKNENEFVRTGAADALGKIGDASAIPALIAALKDKEVYVQWHVADALGQIGAAGILPVIEAIKDEDEWVRKYAADALGKIGAVGILALIEALNDRNEDIRHTAVDALEKLGNSETLPRKILADSRSSAHDRTIVLDRLRCVRYKDQYVALRYRFPETRVLCHTILKEEEDGAHEGAQSVLNWLNGDRHLLHASQPDSRKQSQELVRPAEGSEAETHPETMLRASGEPEKDAEAPSSRTTVWQRLFGKRNGSTF